MRTLLNSLFVLSEDVYLSCKDDNVYVERGKERVGSVPLRSIEHILCFSYKGASPALMGRCAELGVSLSFYSPWGKYYCSIFGENSRNVLLRREQYRIADDESRALPIARSFVIGKIYNARWVLERARRDHAMSINVDRVSTQSQLLADAILSARSQPSIDALRGVEGRAAQDYFFAFDDLILRNKDEFFFESRSRRPPMDRMNALLSFVYVLSAGDCAAALQGVGLDPYVGFLHRDLPGRESLALDLMEELRSVLCDRFALSMVNTGEIRASDFENRENGGVFLTDSGRRTVLTAWKKRKDEVLTHPFLKEKIPWGLVPYVQALLLARTIRGDLDAYPPFMWK